MDGQGRGYRRQKEVSTLVELLINQKATSRVATRLDHTAQEQQ